MTVIQVGALVVLLQLFQAQLLITQYPLIIHQLLIGLCPALAGHWYHGKLELNVLILPTLSLWEVNRQPAQARCLNAALAAAIRLQWMIHKMEQSHLKMTIHLSMNFFF